MKKHKTLLLILVVVLIFVPIIIYAQSGQQATANLLKINKGDGAIENWFMEAFTTLDTNIENMAATTSIFGRAIAGFGALISFGWIGWQMQSGDRDWEIMPIVKPMLIGLILLNWVNFCNLIKAPLEALAKPSSEIFRDIEQVADEYRVKRFEKQNQLIDAVIKTNVKNEAEQSILESFKNVMDKGLIDSATEELAKPVIEWQMRMDYKLQKLLGEFIEFVALAILRVCVYLIFFIQKIWSYILMTLGPLAVGISLIPGLQNSFTNWIAKFININLYTFIAYTIINIGQQLIISGYQMELDRYAQFIDNEGNIINEGLLVMFMTHSGMTFIGMFTAVAYIVTGIGVLMTPTIADTIVSAGGGTIMSKTKQAAGKMGVQKAISMAGKATTGGATKAVTMIASKTRK